MQDTAAIILAAGGSSRLGEPKQLLNYKGWNLVQVAKNAMTEAGCFPVIVVLGASHERVKNVLPDANVVINDQWQQGIASSIRVGLEELLAAAPGVSQFFLSVCDQPFINAKLVTEMQQEAVRSGKGIVACAYADTIGTPVLFNKTYITHLKNLTGDEGAKKLFNAFSDDLTTVSFPLGKFDVDSPEDYKALQAISKEK